MKGRWYRKPMPNPISQELLNSKKFKAHDIKLPFPTQEAAEDAITKAGLSPSGHRRGSSYKCKYCPNWHVTSKRKLATEVRSADPYRANTASNKRKHPPTQLGEVDEHHS